MTDLLALTAELVDIPSESRDEGAITDELEARLRRAPHLDVTRLGNNLVARTQLGRSMRLVLGGHTDTVPASGNLPSRIEGDVLWGLGAADMKAGVAIMLDLALAVAEPAVDLTYVFYECEEIEAAANGLRRLFADAPDLVQGDAAILGEPTGGRVEAGCQGTMRAVVTLEGRRAHTARAWNGVNAIHRLGAVLRRLEDYVPREPVIDGCQFREGMQAVFVDGGVAGNVVPDRATLTVNHRFAPDRDAAAAEAHVREVIGDVDGFEITDMAEGARPGLTQPLLAALVERGGYVPAAKLGWTDVARFAGNGIPACNFGAGDPSVIHGPEERLERDELETVHAALRDLVVRGA